MSAVAYAVGRKDLHFACHGYVIRQIEYRYTRLMSTVQCVEDMSGLRVEDGDTLNILVRSLPAEVHNYALMHSSGATYSSFKEAARKFENQHRLFKDFGAKWSLFGVIPEEVDAGQGEVKNYP